MEQAAELDPFFSGLHLHAGRIFYFLRDYDHAIKEYVKTLELQPSNAMAHEYFGDACAAKGMTHEAITHWRAAIGLSGDEETAALLEQTHNAAGFDKAIRQWGAHELKRFEQQSGQGRYISSWYYAIAHMRCGDKEQALSFLAKAAGEPNWFALQLRLNPLLDPLRADSRFPAIADQGFVGRL